MGPKTATRSSKEPWRSYLRRKGLKTTQQREAIVEAFLASEGHIGLEELLASARKRNPGVGLATVYRTIKLLEDAGLAHSRQFGAGHTLYEIAVDRDHHDHETECGAKDRCWSASAVIVDGGRDVGVRS